MMKLEKLCLRLLVGCFIFLTLTACANRQVILGEPFALGKDEVVNVANADLRIQLEGVGREWDDQGEYVYVSLVVETGKIEDKISIYFDDEWPVGDYVVALVSANPFGDTPSCELIVTQPE